MRLTKKKKKRERNLDLDLRCWALEKDKGSSLQRAAIYITILLEL